MVDTTKMKTANSFMSRSQGHEQRDPGENTQGLFSKGIIVYLVSSECSSGHKGGDTGMWGGWKAGEEPPVPP